MYEALSNAYRSAYIAYSRGVKLISTEGHFNIMAAIKGLAKTIRLYKCYYSLTYC